MNSSIHGKLYVEENVLDNKLYLKYDDGTVPLSLLVLELLFIKFVLRWLSNLVSCEYRKI